MSDSCVITIRIDLRCTEENAVKTEWKTTSAASTEKVIQYPTPSVEKVREHTHAFVNRLEREHLITDDEARLWKENIDQDLEPR